MPLAPAFDDALSSGLDEELFLLLPDTLVSVELHDAFFYHTLITGWVQALNTLTYLEKLERVIIYVNWQSIHYEMEQRAVKEAEASDCPFDATRQVKKYNKCMGTQSWSLVNEEMKRYNSTLGALKSILRDRKVYVFIKDDEEGYGSSRCVSLPGLTI